MQGRTQHPQLLHRGRIRWVPSTLSPAPAAREGGTHTPAAPCPCGLGRDRAGWDGRATVVPWHCQQLPPPCQLGSVLLLGTAPSQKHPGCLPHGHPQPSPRHEASAWAWRCLLPRHRCQRGCYSQPHPKERQVRGEHSLNPPCKAGVGATSPCTLSAAGGPPAARTPRTPKVRSSIQRLGCLAEGWRVLQPWCFRATALTSIPSFTRSTVSHPCLAQFALLAPSIQVAVQVALASGFAPGKAAALIWEWPNWDLRSCLPTSGTHPTSCITASAEVAPRSPTVLGTGGDTGPPQSTFQVQ